MTVNVAFCPAFTVWLAGWEVITGDGVCVIVSVREAIVAVPTLVTPVVFGATL